ncbi:tyrosine-type recombinase/integrase [Paeniglutamicibacter gangotriensis]|uniref:tyrosine-type recombinase/integrase n=1 Tax=Paeniglutamicibacter gangotriensis TaxID=254787 RepID=UPI00165ED1F5|nr:tyrosine-type recombinase/integrase [Paeniglutamicibacter gangotriensis]
MNEIDQYINYLDAIERSPNTQRAAAYDLRAYYQYLESVKVEVDSANAEDLAGFVRSLRRPDPSVPIINTASAARTAATVNRMMSTVGSFYRFRADLGFQGAAHIVRHSRTSRQPERALLDGIARSFESEVVGPRLRNEARHLETLTIQQARTLIDATTLKRDRFLLTLLLTTGMRRGQALGLRHSDLNAQERHVLIQPRRDNANGARAKSRKPIRIPLSRDVCRLYVRYMIDEYKTIDSDYVFITLRGPNRGRALAFETVDALVRRLTISTGIEGWSAHTFRHTWATLHLRAGMKIEVISHLLTHGDPRVTAEVYMHLDVEDLRRQLIDHGCWREGNELAGS